MALKDIIFQKIKEEISQDPSGIGYAGKTKSEILELLNNPARKTRIVEDVSQAPINRILSGIPETSNMVVLTDLNAVLAIT